MHIKQFILILLFSGTPLIRAASDSSSQTDPNQTRYVPSLNQLCQNHIRSHGIDDDAMPELIRRTYLETSINRTLLNYIGPRERNFPVIIDAWSPDGRYAASRRSPTGLVQDTGVRVYDIEQRECMLCRKGAAVQKVLFTPDSNHIIYSRYGQTYISMVNVQNKLVTCYINHGEHINDFILSKDGTLLTLVSHNKVTLYRLPDGERQYVFDHPEPVQQVAITGDRRYLCCIVGDVQMQLWSIEDGKKHLAAEFQGQVEQVNFDAKSTHLAAKQGNRVVLWNIHTKERRYELNHDGMQNMYFHPDGSQIYTLGEGGVRLWDINTGQCVAQKEAHDVRQLLFSNDGKRLIIQSDGNNNVLSSDLNTVYAHQGRQGDSFFLGCLSSLHPNGRYVAGLSSSTPQMYQRNSHDMIKCTDIDTQSCLYEKPVNAFRFFPPRFSPKGKWVIINNKLLLGMYDTHLRELSLQQIVMFNNALQAWQEKKPYILNNPQERKNYWASLPHELRNDKRLLQRPVPVSHMSYALKYLNAAHREFDPQYFTRDELAAIYAITSSFSRRIEGALQPVSSTSSSSTSNERKRERDEDGSHDKGKEKETSEKRQREK